VAVYCTVALIIQPISVPLEKNCGTINNDDLDTLYISILKKNMTAQIVQYQCMRMRRSDLLGLNMFETVALRHFVLATVCGGLVGWERSSGLSE